MPLALRPLTASVTIIASGSSYFNSTSAVLPAGQFRLMRGTVALAGANKASSADLEIMDNDLDWFSTFTVAASVAISIGKLGSTFVSVFVGTIDRTKLSRPTASTGILKITAIDAMQVLMDRLVLTYESHQERNTDGELIQSDAINHLVTDIIINLMNSTDDAVYLNGGNSAITAAKTSAGGQIVHNTGVSIPDVSFHYKPLHDCLKELFDYVKYDWGVDKNGELFGRSMATATHSNVQLDSSTIVNMEIEDDVSETKNVVYVVGGDTMTSIGGTTSPISGSYHNNSSIFIAQKFTAQSDNLAIIQVHVDKVGDPANLAFAVYTDDSNKPSNDAIIYANLEKKNIGTTKAWHQFQVDQKVTKNEAYWITMFAQKNDVNYYRWYTDAGSAASTSTSQDGSTWSTVAATSTLIHNIFYSSPSLGYAPDLKSTSTYGIREMAERQAEITDNQMATFWAKGLVNIMSSKKQLLTINTVAPDTVLIPGQRIRISDDSLVTTNYIMTDVTYELEGHESYQLEVKAMRLVQA